MTLPFIDPSLWFFNDKVSIHSRTDLLDARLVTLLTAPDMETVCRYSSRFDFILYPIFSLVVYLFLSSHRLAWNVSLLAHLVPRDEDRFRRAGSELG